MRVKSVEIIMKHNQTQIDQESDVLDYLNGHMNAEQKQAFEQQLGQDPDLAARLNESQLWQTQILESAAEQETHPLPNFNQFENTLKRKKNRLPLGFSIAAALSVVVVLSFNQTPLVNNEFETLTDTRHASELAKLQIVFTSGVDTEQFIQDYQLKVMHSYDNGNIIDVGLTPLIEEQLSLLSADQRTMLVKQIGESK
jgi:hypothetical protein